MTNISFFISKMRVVLLMLALSCLSFVSFAQNTNTNPLPVPQAPIDTDKKGIPVFKNSPDTGAVQSLTLQQCIDYALLHQPALNRSLININIAKTTNAINLAGLLPQVNANGDLIHYIQQSNASNSVVTGTGTTTSTTTGGTVTPVTGSTGTNTTGTSARSNGFSNTFIPGISVSQSIFSPSLLYAYKSAPLYIKQAEEVTDSTKIFLASSISKSFYNVLLNLEQIGVLREDTARLDKNLRDAYHQYKGGIVDETDYLEASITLNNSKAQLRQANENIVPQYAALKQLMGFPPEKQFNVNFDTLEMMRSINLDTTKQLRYEKRIEYLQLLTQKGLQTQLINYYRSAFLPTVSAFFNYNLAFENNRLPDILQTSYPSSLIGLSLSIPIFTGFARINNVKKARLQEQLLDWNETELKSQIYTEYTSALANYKGNLYNLQLLQKNVTMAKRTYFVVTLQYKQGIVAYLNVITAESNLITSEISYLNALSQVLSSKIDLEKAMGDITY